MMSLRGSACIYQGEELGLPEAEVAYADLKDPYGIRFWPEFKGRDGARTPMVWTASNRNAGFSEGEPWLPVAREHLAFAVEVQEPDPDALLHYYRRAIASRRTHRALAKGAQSRLRAQGDLLSFTRALDEETIFCAFNLGGAPARVALPQGRWRLLDGRDDSSPEAIVEQGEAFVALGPWQSCRALKL